MLCRVVFPLVAEALPPLSDVDFMKVFGAQIDRLTSLQTG